jgi:hypothetical protein
VNYVKHSRNCVIKVKTGKSIFDEPIATDAVSDP